MCGAPDAIALPMPPNSNFDRDDRWPLPSPLNISSRRNLLTVGLYRVACGVILLGAPVELFASLSLELRRVHFGPILIATLATGWDAYFPDKAAFHEGAYEAEVARA